MDIKIKADYVPEIKIKAGWVAAEIDTELEFLVRVPQVDGEGKPVLDENGVQQYDSVPAFTLESQIESVLMVSTRDKFLTFEVASMRFKQIRVINGEVAPNWLFWFIDWVLNPVLKVVIPQINKHFLSTKGIPFEAFTFGHVEIDNVKIEIGEGFLKLGANAQIVNFTKEEV